MNFNGLSASSSPPQSLLKYLQITYLHEVSRIKVSARGVMGRLNPPITPCALTFPSLEASAEERVPVAMSML